MSKSYSGKFIIENKTDGSISNASVQHYNEESGVTTNTANFIGKNGSSGTFEVKTFHHGEDYWTVSFLDSEGNLFFTEKIEWGMKTDDGAERPFNVQLYDNWFRIVGTSHISEEKKYYQVENWKITA
ncbi:MAG: hypothetical protein H6581_10900 [Bacteroidia bacterium]|nr:hypothetical protein [Bacteroidia bacterium]